MHALASRIFGPEKKKIAAKMQILRNAKGSGCGSKTSGMTERDKHPRRELRGTLSREENPPKRGGIEGGRGVTMPSQPDAHMKECAWLEEKYLGG